MSDADDNLKPLKPGTRVRWRDVKGKDHYGIVRHKEQVIASGQMGAQIVDYLAKSRPEGLFVQWDETGQLTFHHRNTIRPSIQNCGNCGFPIEGFDYLCPRCRASLDPTA